MEQGEFDMLLHIASDLNLVLRRAALAQAISDASLGFAEDEAQMLVDAMVGIQRTIWNHQWDAEAVAESLSKAGSLAVPESDQAEFKSRLGRLLANDGLRWLARAIDVARAQPHDFHAARIISEIRPLFSDKAEELPFGALVLHTLKIDYYDDSGAREFFVTLDNSGLDSLERAVSRAREKGGSLVELLGSTPVSTYELKDF